MLREPTYKFLQLRRVRYNTDISASVLTAIYQRSFFKTIDSYLIHSAHNFFKMEMKSLETLETQFRVHMNNRSKLNQPKAGFHPKTKKEQKLSSTASIHQNYGRLLARFFSFKDGLNCGAGSNPSSVTSKKTHVLRTYCKSFS